MLLAIAAVLLVALLIVQTRGKDEKKPEGEGFGRATAPTRTNVLLIIADDVGVDKIGAYADDADDGYRDSAVYLPDTPTIDGLAANGVRFSHAWAHPTCSPTRAAIMTGLHAFRTQVGQPIGRAGSAELDPDSTTSLAEVVAARGYSTGLFGKWHLGDTDPPASWAKGDSWDDHLGESFDHVVHPIAHGFDRFAGTIEGDLVSAGGGGSYTDWVAIDATHCDDCDQSDSVVAEARTEYATDATVRDALAWIDEQTGPWMAVVALHSAHDPFELPAEGCSYRDPDTAAGSSDIAVYEEMVECLDRGLGDLLDGVDDLDDTLVIFIGDNGTGRALAEGVYSDGRGKGTIYETGVRVPFIMADGRVLAKQRDSWVWTQDWMLSERHVGTTGRVLDDPVQDLDLFATIADVVDGDGSSGIDSISLLPLLQDTEGEVRAAAYTEQFDRDGVGQAALRRDNYKLLVFTELNGSGACVERYELYDLDADRFEDLDLVDDEPEVAAQLLAELEAITTSDDSWVDVPSC